MRVLLVEDTEAIRSTIAKILEFSGISCDAVEDIQPAIFLLGAQSPHARYDALICDLFLPSGSAGKLFAHVQALAPDQRPATILCSAAEAAGVEARRLKADYFLAKPFEVDALLALLCRSSKKSAGVRAGIPPRQAQTVALGAC